MGHTIPAMRWIIYDKLNQFRKIAKGLREPERSIASSLIYDINQGISAIVYANPMPKELEDSLIFTILIQEKKKGSVGLENLTIKLFSQIILHKMMEIEDDRLTDRHLEKPRQDNPVG